MTACIQTKPHRNFNPHSPCGERRHQLLLIRCRALFQSTLPMRGATAAVVSAGTLPSISIHTPHAGSDRGDDLPACPVGRFQSTLPMRGATCPCQWLPSSSLIFQSTLPMRGATSSFSLLLIPAKLFQSTLPMRGATAADGICRAANRFQSTLPMRGATCAMRPISARDGFQSTLPMRGATRIYQGIRPDDRDFNPHSPCGERRHCKTVRAEKAGISIHTPHAGSDPVIVLLLLLDRHFNPHSPCGERRLRSLRPSRLCGFQSTLPMRGATLTTVCIISQLNGHFNPHSPCGERPLSLMVNVCWLQFQSTLPMRGATSMSAVTCRCLTYFNPHSPCGERPAS